jgi:hypothetical protein
MSASSGAHTEHRAPEEDMKGVVFLGDRKLELREFPDPARRDPSDQGVGCGSDLHTYRAPANPGGVVTGGIKRAAGVIAGHEPCGVVAAAGIAIGLSKACAAWPVLSLAGEEQRLRATQCSSHSTLARAG